MTGEVTFGLAILSSAHRSIILFFLSRIQVCEKVQVGKDQEKAQSEKDSHSKNRGGKN